MKTLNKQNMQRYVKHLESRSRVTIITKNSPEYKLCVNIIKNINRCSSAKAVKYLEGRCMSFPGEHIWLNFEPGVTKNSRALCGQVAVIVHELVHNAARLKDATFDVKYFVDQSYRCRTEIEALKEEMCIYHAFGYRPNVKAMVNMLRTGGYRLREKDLKVAYASLLSANKLARKGAVYGSVARRTRAWWT